MSGSIHDEHPFVPPPEHRDQLRRFRGRLVAPVTILTAGEATNPAGITVSSVIVAEGEPGRVAAVVGDLTDFWDAAIASGRFVVQILDASRRKTADRFAGIRPSPGGPFAGEDLEETRWGVRLAAVEDWAGCRVESGEDLGYQRLLVGVVEELSLSELTDPLVYHRGQYRRLG